MTQREYGSWGGAGGVHAHTVDMEHAAGVIDRVLSQIDVARASIASQLTYARMARDVSYGSAAHTPAWRAEQSLEVVNDWRIGLPALEQDLEDLARRLRLATEQYLEAERANRVRVSALQQSWRSLRDGVETDIWARRHAASALWSVVTFRHEHRSWRQAVSDWIRPSGLPPTTGYLNRNSAQSFLAMVDRPEPLPQFTYEFLAIHLSGVLLMLRQWSGADVMTAVEPLPEVKPLPPPEDISGLFEGVYHAHRGHRGVVGIHEVTQPDGSSAYVVYIPGTEDWTLGGSNPFNTPSNSLGVVGEVTEAMAVTVAAMAAAGIPADAPVMLAGYSQGGITATALAASSGFTSKYNVTHVATAGSPTGRLPRADGVNYIHLEILEDVTPGVDGASNPDLAHVTTVEMSLRDSPDPEVAAWGRDVEGAHHPDSYRVLSGLADADPTSSIQSWTRSAEAFIGGASAEYSEFQAVPETP